MSQIWEISQNKAEHQNKNKTTTQLNIEHCSKVSVGRICFKNKILDVWEGKVSEWVFDSFVSWMLTPPHVPERVEKGISKNL